MASIILSFVGNQDPFSDHTQKEGSIVTLVRYFVEKSYVISCIFLLYTTTTEQGAKDTKEWLESSFNLSENVIKIILVDSALSDDPVNLLLAAQEARKAILEANNYLTTGDRLEFNSSSGTPVMKSAWNILQAAGYARNSRVWQIRNPDKIQAGQDQVFQTNVDVLKNEFDLKIIKSQIADYNYSGALITLKESNLNTEIITVLLKYGHCRISFDFKQAFNEIKKFTLSVDKQLIDQISTLTRRDEKTLLKESYYNSLIRLKNQEYSNFLVGVAGFQEGFLKFLMSELGFNLPDNYAQTYRFWKDIQKFDNGKLYQFLEKNFHPDSFKGFVNRPVMIGIIEYSAKYLVLVPLIKELNEYSQQRNQYIHSFDGVSNVEDSEKIVKILYQILTNITKVSEINPFDNLNQMIYSLLETEIKENQ